jgi:hypothetical protein
LRDRYINRIGGRRQCFFQDEIERNVTPGSALQRFLTINEKVSKSVIHVLAEHKILTQTLRLTQKVREKEVKMALRTIVLYDVCPMMMYNLGVLPLSKFELPMQLNCLTCPKATAC